MLSEHELRQALQDDGAPYGHLSAQDIVRRGHRRRVVVGSAAGAGALGVVGVIAVTGVVIADGSPSSSATIVAGGGASAAASPTPQVLPSASYLPRAVPSVVPSPPAEVTVLPSSTPHTVTNIDFAGGKVAYSLRPEPIFDGRNGLLLDSAAPDGTLTIKVDGGLPANPIKGQWWANPGGHQNSTWMVYGVVPAGSSQVRLVVDGHSVPVTTKGVPGATGLAFYVSGPVGGTAEGDISALHYTAADGSPVTVTTATGQGVG